MNQVGLATEASPRAARAGACGATLIEAVIVTPLFLLIIFVGIQAIWLSWQMIGLQYVTIQTVNEAVLGLCRQQGGQVGRCDSPLMTDGGGVPSVPSTIKTVCTRRYDHVRDVAINTARRVGLVVEESDIQITSLGGSLFPAAARDACRVTIQNGTTTITQQLGLPGDTLQVTIARNVNLLGGNSKGYGVQDGQVVRGLLGPILIERSAWGVVEQFAG